MEDQEKTVEECVYHGSAGPLTDKGASDLLKTHFGRRAEERVGKAE